MRAATFHFLTAVLFVGAGLTSAAVVNLSGTVYDKDNKPLPGVVVSLAKGGLADTTGADGKWVLAGNSTGISRTRQNPSARWDGKVLHLNLISPATVQVESFDARGAHLGTLALARLEAGNHSLPMGSARSATGMRWLRLSVDGKSQVIATGGGFRFDQALPASLARSAEDSVDQLIYMLQGQLITADTVRTLIQSGLEKWVQEFSVSGKVTADARVSVDSVFAWFDGGRMTGMRRGRLGFNKANSAYSGRIYTVKSLTGDVFNYRVWLNVMGNSNKRTGISDTTDFSSDFGAIDFIPVFTTGNAIPSGSIVGPVTGLVNTNHSFKLALDRKDEQLAHIEWDLGTGLGFAAGKDTITGRWLQPGSYGVQARLTDIDSNVAVLTKTVNVTNQAAVVAGIRDTDITVDDVVSFSLTVHDTDGVAKVLWDFGDGKKDSSFTGETHMVSHRYPTFDSLKIGYPAMSDSILKANGRGYPLTVTVVDRLGNQTVQTAMIHVFDDIPNVWINDTVGEPNQLVTLHASAYDRGTITKVEWSVNGSIFATGGKDTTIKLPSAAGTTVKFVGSAHAAIGCG